MLTQPLVHSSRQLVVELPRTCGHVASKCFSDLIKLPPQCSPAAIKAKMPQGSEQRLKNTRHAPFSAANSYRERRTGVLKDCEGAIAWRHDRAA